MQWGPSGHEWGHLRPLFSPGLPLRFSLKNKLKTHKLLQFIDKQNPHQGLLALESEWSQVR